MFTVFDVFRIIIVRMVAASASIPTSTTEVRNRCICHVDVRLDVDGDIFLEGEVELQDEDMFEANPMYPGDYRNIPVFP